MSSNPKKYYWLKLKDDFFMNPKIKKLRKIAGGDTYTIILQKIMLLSIKSEGLVEFQHIEKTFSEELALHLDEETINVEVTLQFMNSNGLIESNDEDHFILPFIPELIGSEVDSAERVRRLRNKRKDQLSLQCNVEVTECNTEKEKEKEINTYAPNLEAEFESVWKQYTLGFIVPMGRKGGTKSKAKASFMAMRKYADMETINNLIAYTMNLKFGHQDLERILKKDSLEVLNRELVVANNNISKPTRELAEGEGFQP
jgi:predicted phage replisome organizer